MCSRSLARGPGHGGIWGQNWSQMRLLKAGRWEGVVGGVGALWPVLGAVRRRRGGRALCKPHLNTSLGQRSVFISRSLLVMKYFPMPWIEPSFRWRGVSFLCKYSIHPHTSIQIVVFLFIIHSHASIHESGTQAPTTKGSKGTVYLPVQLEPITSSISI